MVGNRLEQEIIRVFNSDILTQHSILSISKKLGKAYPHINQKINSLISQEVIRKEVRGKSYLCSLNLQSELAIALLSIDEINKKKEQTKRIPRKILDLVNLLLSTKKTKNIIYSNTNLYIITEEDTKKVFSKKKTKNAFFLTNQEFKEEIFSDLSIIKNALILQSYEDYFSLLKEEEERLRAIKQLRK
ncbi:hypothetical protein GOV05_01120 [Candidatus Woesearchaeota archaeon]|nr:hypothetical protein [Candidatus Woesearchaeota archaeon]